MNTALLERDGLLAAVEAHAEDVLLLLVGFDGVLVDYEADPDSVCLSPERRSILEAFAERPNCVLGVISGRRVSDLRRRADLGDRAFYVGLHGLEIEGPGLSMTEGRVFENYRDRIHEIAATLESSMSSVAGVRIEDKEAAIAVHTREAGSRDAVWARVHCLSTAAQVVNRSEMRIIRGNHVFELMPDLCRPRATAVREIRRYLHDRGQEPVCTVYIGEDVADDDAFQAIAGAGVAAAVGARAPKAQFHLSSTTEVWLVIEQLTAQRRPSEVR